LSQEEKNGAATYRKEKKIFVYGQKRHEQDWGVAQDLKKT
jgi:hypothetical protein